MLPMVIARRNYTLMQGQDTQLEHDFEALQKQLEERFIKGKTRIIPDVSCMSLYHLIGFCIEYKTTCVSLSL